jgi:hypothetical protein
MGWRGGGERRERTARENMMIWGISNGDDKVIDLGMGINGLMGFEMFEMRVVRAEVVRLRRCFWMKILQECEG